jgi:acetyl-CoA acetyltransferase family protein
VQFQNVYIPYGAYWSTPFSKWQGSFAGLHPVKFAAEMGSRFLAERKIPGERIDGVCLGMTVPSRNSFYGAPWLAGMLGLGTVTGPSIGQACATSVRCVVTGATEIMTCGASVFLAVAADKTSNGPHIYYPDPGGIGGTGQKEDWVLDNFGFDPYAKNAMIETAEKVAAEAGIERGPQDEVALIRYQQYRRALDDDRAFQRRYMLTPVELKNKRGKVLATVETDEGVFPTTKEGLEKLRPVMDGGTVTFGTQTFPADGNAGMVVTDRETAKELSRDSSVEVRVLSYAQARVGKGMMPMANVPASRLAIERAGITMADVKAITSHTPFALNDVYFGREMEVPVEEMNRYGCSLVWGHPQGPTGLRGIIELIEELAILGGGHGLFTGCAAGDTAAALVVEVT